MLRSLVGQLTNWLDNSSWTPCLARQAHMTQYKGTHLAPPVRPGRSPEKWFDSFCKNKTSARNSRAESCEWFQSMFTCLHVFSTLVVCFWSYQAFGCIRYTQPNHLTKLYLWIFLVYRIQDTGYLVVRVPGLLDDKSCATKDRLPGHPIFQAQLACPLTHLEWSYRLQFFSSSWSRF